MTDREQLTDIIANAQQIVIIQADNPDADSLASALALECILHEMGKEPTLYCGIDMPQYLRYLSGWDRVSNELPKQCDASIIVDTSTLSLLEQLRSTGADAWLAHQPCIVLDHHAETAGDIPFATVMINDPAKVSTGELIFDIAKQAKWQLPLDAAEHIMTSILSDSMGLSTENTTPETYRTMAELIEIGVNRPKLEEQRRAFNKMQLVIFRYKAELIRRTEIIDDTIALVTIPQTEINEYSPLYNPAPLIQPDHLQTEGVRASIVFKTYDSGRITAAIRCNQTAPVAGKLAEHFGGGGHKYAAGFKLEGRLHSEVKQAVVQKLRELLA